jgi:hypothetical protein
MQYYLGGLPVETIKDFEANIKQYAKENRLHYEVEE